MERNVLIEDANEYIKRAYECAKTHGFHEQKLSVEHCFMLIITEIAEAVEADRKGRYASLPQDISGTIFDHRVFHNNNKHFKENFEEYVKDSVADELADVCIRIYDTCGAFGVEPIVTDLYDFDNVDMFKKGSFCERCYHLVSIFSLRESESAPLSFVLGMALMFVRYICDKMHIDIVRHIEWKMMYNELRPLRNGKNY